MTESSQSARPLQPTAQAAPKQRRYRLYVDESGDHTRTDPVDVGKRYLGLVGVVFTLEAHQAFYKDLEDVKRRHLDYDSDDPPVLHREEIVRSSGVFHVLKDPGRRERWNSDLLSLIARTPFKIIAVVVDKHVHFSTPRPRAVAHPYHYGLEEMLGRYCGRLQKIRARGDVLAESRRGREDEELKAAYRKAWNNGTDFLAGDVTQATLTSREIKLKSKEANIAGLQLADLLAHPGTREVLRSHGRIDAVKDPFAGRLMTAVEKKFYGDPPRFNGFGKVLL